ncbi:MAG TPA: hypothetical protein VI039_11250 [Solirubrobacterales bacterium]
MIQLRSALAILAAIAFIAVADEVRAASGNLSVEAEATWHADPTFAIAWDPIPPPNPTEAVYRIFDAQEQLALAFRRPLHQATEPIEAPAAPGVYRLEAWLENGAGVEGAHSSATLRFDDTVPAMPAVSQLAGWALSADDAEVSIGPSPDPPPPSGIRGYALSVDRGSGSSPCGHPSQCEPAEIDLAGAAGGAVSLGTLPEGISFVRVLAVSGAGVASAPITAEVRIDGSAPIVSLQGASASWSSGPLALTAVASDQLSGMAAAGPLGPFTAITIDGAAATSAPGNAVTAWVTGSGIHRVEYFARDAAGNVADGRAAGSATVRIDAEPPRVAFVATQDPADPERIEAIVSDDLSGPSDTRGSIGVRLAGTRARFEQLPTQVGDGHLIARWDSDSYPEGKYEFSATGYDLAGNVGGGANRTGGGRMVLINPLKIATAIAAGFGKGSKQAKRIRSGGRVKFSGQLRTRNGPLTAGLPIVITENFAAGAKPARRITLIQTRADGTFSAGLAPGPSREVTASFAGNRLLTCANSEPARLLVPAAVRLRTSAGSARIGGAPIVFSGMLAGDRVEPTARAGLPVELQFRFRGSGWREFRTLETDRRGRFHYRYRFSDDDSRGIRFQFRAYIKDREGWPYEPSASRPVLITGR